MPFLYVYAVVNGRNIDVMVDTGVTQNFVSDRAATWVELNLGEHTNRFKTINSKRQPVAGIVKGMTINLGSWQAKINLLSVSLNDFELILDINSWQQ